MEYPKLYNRDSKDKIRVWWMEQDENAYRTISGLLDGKLVCSKYTLAEPKNEGRTNATTSQDQATKEIEAKYEKQIKLGYVRSLDDIDQTPHHFQVMLAKNFKDYEDKIDWGFGVIVQIKFNGFRCVATKDGLFTRKGEKYVSVPHIERDLRKLFERYPRAVLDGELYNYDLRQRLNEIAKICRKTRHITVEDLADSEKMIRYYVYDGFGMGQTKLTTPGSSYAARKMTLDEYLPRYTKYTAHVTDWLVHSRVELDELYQQFLQDEQEGAIIRLPGSPYEGKRSKYLLKYKPVDDAEFVITDIQEGVGNWAGTGKIITFRMPDGKTFNGSFKGSWDEAAAFLKEKDKWIGREVTILYNGLTGLGTPNYARMDIHNCIKE